MDAERYILGWLKRHEATREARSYQG
jgi:hypothetical protein